MSKNSSHTEDSKSPLPEDEKLARNKAEAKKRESQEKEKKASEKDVSKLITLSKKRPLDAREIGLLLWVNPKTGKREYFEKYCEIHKKAYQKHYGKTDFKEALRRDLDGRFRDVQNMLYVSGVKVSQRPKIKRIGGQGGKRLSGKLLDIIEKSGKAVNFNYSEIKRLLWRDQETGAYPHLYSFYLDNKDLSVFPTGVTEEDIMTTLRVELQGRLQEIDDVLYFKGLEDSLSTKVDKRLGQTATEFREVIGKVVGKMTALDFKKISQIRSADRVDILEGDLRLSQKTIKDYIKLVRAEMGLQLQRLGELEDPSLATPDKEQKTRDAYEKVGYLFEFLASNFDDDDGAKKSYLKAFLMRKMRSEKGLTTIKTWYEELQKHMKGNDFGNVRQSIRAMVDRLHQEANMQRADHLRDILKAHAPDIQISDEDIRDIFQKDAAGNDIASVLRDSTYVHKIGCHLEEIEMTSFQIGVEESMTDIDPGVLAGRRALIANQLKGLKQALEEFKGQKHTVEILIETKFKSLPFSKRYKLTQVADNIATITEHDTASEQNAFAARLEAIRPPEKAGGKSIEEQVNEILLDAEKSAFDYLVRRGCELSDLHRLKNNDPDFDVYEFLMRHEDDLAAKAEDEETGGHPQIERRPLAGPEDPARSVTKEEAEELDTSPYLKGEALNKVKAQLDILQQICDGNFSQPDAFEVFDRTKKEIESLTKGQYYLIEEVINDESGKAVFEGNEQAVRKAKEVKKLPYVDESRLFSMQSQREHHSQFQKSHKILAGLGVLENDNGKIQNALAALYAEMSEWTNETQVKKLTKVMSIDHPLTAIRFNPEKKQPFLTNDEKRYHMHDIRGKPTLTVPATYKVRAQDLLRDAKRLMKEGNYAELMRYFRQGERGDRLYMDAAFFPVKLLKGKNAERTNLLYEQKIDKHTKEPVFDNDGKPVLVPSSKIPLEFHKELDLNNEIVQKKLNAITSDSELSGLPDCLADDGDFISAMKLDKETQAMLNEYQEALVLNEETGETTIDEAKIREIVRRGTKIMGAGAGGADEDEAIKLTKERLDEISKDNPLAAARAAQFNSEMVGRGLAGVQHAGRKMVDLLKLGPKMASEFGQAYWKGLTFYSPMSLYFAIEQAGEHISALADFRVKFKSYMLMANMFKGTIIGSEFEKLLQGKENERVDDFKKAFDQYGNQDVLDKMTGARDRFEFKQTLIQVFQERGLVTNEDLCKIAFLKTLNKFNPNYNIRIKWTDEEMAKDADVREEVLEEIKKSIDKFWGGGQFQSWKNAGVQKYESWRKQSYDNFNQYGGGDVRQKIYAKYWDWIKNDPDKLKAMHPGELVGNIENDMAVGHLNSGASFAIFQALLIEGYIKYEHLKRLELTDHHINNLPFFTLLEPKEAELSGLKDAYLKCKHLPYEADKNPFVGFYEGKTALKLNSFRFQGKWLFAKNQKEFDDQKAKGNIREVSMTAHQLQRRREAQPEWFKKMDNNSIGLFLPAYNWGQIEHGLSMDNNGEISGARPHDLCAGYRGMQWEFTGYLEAMSDRNAHPELDDATRFKQQIYFAYEALSKNGALAGYFSRQKDRKIDYAFNSDGSPNFDNRVTEERAKSGKTNFEKQILDISGHNQRLNESATTLDSMKTFDEDASNGTITYDLRKAFKRMSGHKHLKSLGMDEVTGKANPSSYTTIDIKTFDPSGVYRDEAIPAFVDNVLRLAEKRGMRKEIAKSLGIDTYGPTGVFGNFGIGNVRRDHILNEWKINEAQML